MIDWPNRNLSRREKRILREFKANASIAVGLGFLVAGAVMKAGFLPNVTPWVFFSLLGAAFLGADLASNCVFKFNRKRPNQFVVKIMGLDRS